MDEEAFRSQVRDWFSANVPAGWQTEFDALPVDAWLEFMHGWLHTLDAAGYAAPHVPKEWGGGGLTVREQTLLHEVWAQAGAPYTDLFEIGLNHVPATFLHAGSDAQKERYIRPALRGDEIWCQGFSEPGAGSDLAALQTAAVVEGDHLVVNGQKIWSSHAQYARFCLLLVRTSKLGAPQAGITYVVLDMTSPGVEVRPIQQITGKDEFCEVFLDDVHVPLENVIGGIGDGWRIAQSTLTAERGPIGVPTIAGIGVGLATLRSALSPPVGSEPTARESTLATFSARYEGVRSLAMDTVDALDHSAEGSSGSLASVMKVSFSELLQNMHGYAASLQGEQALLDPGQHHFRSYVSGAPAIDWLQSWAWTIAGGTNEIQRNIIAERILLLPRPGKPATSSAGRVRAALSFAGLIGDQRDVADLAEEVFAKEAADVHAGAGLGWSGIGIDEDAGGAGGSFADLAPLVEAAGAATAATGAGIAAGVVGPLLAAAGAPLLDRVAVPVAIGSSLLLGPLDAPVAVPAVIDGEERLVLVPAGHATTVVGLDVSRPWSRLGDVALADLPSYTVSFAEWRWRMALVSALDAAGAARGALAGMLEHAQTREQFGVAIGSFQAYKHQCADAYIELKLAQSLAFRAASTGDPRLALAAGLLAPAAARAICGTAVQLMGGIGFTWEGGVHVNLKRALADEVLAGAGARELLAAYAEAR